jgi:hypothetical protein
METSSWWKMATKLCSSLLGSSQRNAHATDGCQGRLVLSAGVGDNPLQVANKELHTAVIVFGPEPGLGIGFYGGSWDEEPVAEVVQVLGRLRGIGSAEDGFDSSSMNAISRNYHVAMDGFATLDRNGWLVSIL